MDDEAPLATSWHPEFPDPLDEKVEFCDCELETYISDRRPGMEQQPIEVRLADVFPMYHLHGVAAVLPLSCHDDLVNRFRLPLAVPSDRVPRIVIPEPLRALYRRKEIIIPLFQRIEPFQFRPIIRADQSGDCQIVFVHVCCPAFPVF